MTATAMNMLLRDAGVYTPVHVKKPEKAETFETGVDQHADQGSSYVHLSYASKNFADLAAEERVLSRHTNDAKKTSASVDLRFAADDIKDSEQDAKAEQAMAAELKDVMSRIQQSGIPEPQKQYLIRMSWYMIRSTATQEKVVPGEFERKISETLKMMEQKLRKAENESREHAVSKILKTEDAEEAEKGKNIFDMAEKAIKDIFQLNEEETSSLIALSDEELNKYEYLTLPDPETEGETE